MKTTVTLRDFRAAFRKFSRGGSFSYEGYRALFNWIEAADNESGTETELDVIALCREFFEYSDIKEFHEDYDKEKYPNLQSIEDLLTVITVGKNGFIIDRDF